MEKLKIATVFSGIGAFEQSLEKLKIDYEIVFACDNGEREIEGTKEEIIENAKNEGVELVDFVRYALGEGIEKKQEDFASEVAAQINK